MIAVSRHLHVGEATDCGRSDDGTFGGSNICSSGRRKDELDEDARIRAKKWVRSPAGQAALDAAKRKDLPKYPEFASAIRELGVESDRSEISRVAAIYYAVIRESWEFAKKLGGDHEATYRAMAPLDLAILKWLAGSGHVNALPKLLGKIPIGALFFLLNAEKPSLSMVRRARKMIRLTAKRLHTGSADKEGKVTFRRRR